MKFASEEIRTKAVHAYLEGKATARQLADILTPRLPSATGSELIVKISDYQPNQTGIAQVVSPMRKFGSYKPFLIKMLI